MRLFPENDKARKMLVLFKYLTRYFPKAHREVTKVCVVNNVRYNPDREPNDIHWARSKSPDQLGSAFRHMAEYEVDGKVFEDVPEEIAKITGIDKVYTLAEAMWRIGAQLELEIEKQEATANGLQIRSVPTEADFHQSTSELMPKCPVCGFREHVFNTPPNAPTLWCCETGHPIFYFNAELGA